MEVTFATSGTPPISDEEFEKRTGMSVQQFQAAAELLGFRFPVAGEPLAA